jgi:hypothetical protein
VDCQLSAPRAGPRLSGLPRHWQPVNTRRPAQRKPFLSAADTIMTMTTMATMATMVTITIPIMTIATITIITITAATATIIIIII